MVLHRSYSRLDSVAAVVYGSVAPGFEEVRRSEQLDETVAELLQRSYV